MVFDIHSVMAERVREAIAHWARFYPRPRDVDEVVVLAGLSEKADAYARTLSGGQLALIVAVYFFLGFFIGGILHK